MIWLFTFGHMEQISSLKSLSEMISLFKQPSSTGYPSGCYIMHPVKILALACNHEPHYWMSPIWYWQIFLVPLYRSTIHFSADVVCPGAVSSWLLIFLWSGLQLIYWFNKYWFISFALHCSMLFAVERDTGEWAVESLFQDLCHWLVSWASKFLIAFCIPRKFLLLDIGLSAPFQPASMNLVNTQL